jgi:uncharacterized protein (TIGR00251 family)
MILIKKRNDYEYLFYLNVKPNSKKQTIIKNGDSFIVHLLSTPSQNKANKELISFLRKKLKISSDHMQIVSGSKSSTKIINLIFEEKVNEQEIIDKLIK